LQSDDFAGFFAGVDAVYIGDEFREKSIQSAVAGWDVEHADVVGVSAFQKLFELFLDELRFLF